MLFEGSLASFAIRYYTCVLPLRHIVVVLHETDSLGSELLARDDIRMLNEIVYPVPLFCAIQDNSYLRTGGSGSLQR